MQDVFVFTLLAQNHVKEQNEKSGLQCHVFDDLKFVFFQTGT
jgi:hypothetical protein